MSKIIETFSFVVDENGNEQRLDKYISESLEEVTRSYVEKLIGGNFVRVNDILCNKKSKKLKLNDRLEIDIPEEDEIELSPENIPIDIVYENENFLIINKQAGLVVHPANGHYSGTLVNALIYRAKNLSDLNGKHRLGIIHRLDKDTSGLLIVAKNNFAHAKLSEMFLNKTIKKTYICIVKGNFSEEKKIGRIENLIGRDTKDRKKMAVVDRNGKTAITNYRVLESKNNFSLLEVKIETGRTHQIRVHMRSIGHPILGDEVYGNKTNGIERQMLHAYKLEFINPIDNLEYNFVGEIPGDFLNVCKKIGFNINF